MSRTALPSQPIPCSAGCGAMLKHEPRRKGTMCRACCNKQRRRPDVFCEVCNVPIHRRSKRATRMCREHASKSEQRLERQRAAMAVLHADPEYQRRRGRAVSAAKLAHIPLEYRKYYLELMRTKGLTMVERIEVVTGLVASDTRTFLATGILPQTSREKEAQ